MSEVLIDDVQNEFISFIMGYPVMLQRIHFNKMKQGPKNKVQPTIQMKHKCALKQVV